MCVIILRVRFHLFQTIRNHPGVSGDSSILSELGTFSLEFNYLSRVTNKDIFNQTIEKLMATINGNSRKSFGGVYPIYVNPLTGGWGEKQFSIGLYGGSFYEYLLKSWLFSGRQDNGIRLMYTAAIEGALNKLVGISDGGLYFFEHFGSKRMHHLACFSGIDPDITSFILLASCSYKREIVWFLFSHRRNVVPWSILS